MLVHSQNEMDDSIASVITADTYPNCRMQSTKKQINPLGLLSDVVNLRATYDPVEMDTSSSLEEDAASPNETGEGKKRVKFHTTVQISPIESPLDVLCRLGMPSDGLFYAMEEVTFLYQSEVDALFNEAYAPSGRVSSNMRGFEFRSSRERQRRSRLGRQMTLQQQKRLSADRLAELSLRCSQWASTIAQKTGTLDFVQVYLDVDRLPSESLIAIARMQREVLDPSLIQPQHHEETWTHI